MQLIPNDLEIKELMNALLNEPEHYRYYYFLAIYTGCRRGELCALKWSDFQMINDIPTLTVSRSRSALPYSGVVEKGTKNNKERSILLSQDIYGVVKGYYYFKKMQCEELKIKMSEYLFTDDKGTLIHPDTFSKRLRNELEYPKAFHLHTLQHYFVSAMLHSGVDKQTVADLAGHGDTSFLERTYCHPQTLAKQKASVGMANILFDSTAYIDADGKEQIIKTA
ncbi:MAG: site-specific integrase [Oscillospiraceae bacterium]